MAKVTKKSRFSEFSLLELRELNYGIQAMTIGYNAFSNDVVPSDEANHSVSMVLILQQSILDEICLRITDSEAEAIDKAYQQQAVSH